MWWLADGARALGDRVAWVAVVVFGMEETPKRASCSELMDLLDAREAQVSGESGLEVLDRNRDDGIGVHGSDTFMASETGFNELADEEGREGVVMTWKECVGASGRSSSCGHIFWSVSFCIRSVR